MMESARQFNFTTSELIDQMSISQIKEVLLSVKVREFYKKELADLAHDLDLALSRKNIKVSGKILRAIILLSQTNLHVWYNKDKMQANDNHYLELLSFAQEVNGIRNHIKNLLNQSFDEDEACLKKATFLKSDKGEWYSQILTGLESK